MRTKLLVGVDGSDESVAALRWAANHPQALDAVIEVVHVWEDSPLYAGGLASAVAGMYPGPGSRTELVEDSLAEQARAVCVEAIAQADLRDTVLDLRPRTVCGSPGVVLTELARDADLLVVGPSGHGALWGGLLGSVVLHLVTHASCPVVVVRGED
jgi:nucleotide-binding universal stress UspA family protein